MSKAQVQALPSEHFKSFWMAGYEGACHINLNRQRLDLGVSTGHMPRLDDDYRALRPFGIRTVREAFRWHAVEPAPGRYELADAAEHIRAARRHGLQVLWTLLYYGWPEHYDILSPRWVDAFGTYARTIAQLVRSETDEIPWYIVANEPSYMAFAIGEERTMFPFHGADPAAVKRQLVRAQIVAIEAIRGTDPRARFVHVDPLFYVVPPRNRPELAEAAARHVESQFESAFLLAGRLEPELGGAEEYLDVVGLNYYYNNQWEYPLIRQLDWRAEPLDERRLPLHDLLSFAYERYQRPFIISETGNYRDGRARWISDIAEGVNAAWARNLPLHGVCLFPAVDRHDWYELDHWHRAGLWDVDPSTLDRTLNFGYADALRRAQERVASASVTPSAGASVAV